MTDDDFRSASRTATWPEVLTLQPLTPMPEDEKETDNIARTGEFSLHAGIAANTHQRDKIERLCRYILTLRAAKPIRRRVLPRLSADRKALTLGSECGRVMQGKPCH